VKRFRRTVWVGRDLERPSSPTPCHEQGHLPPDQVAQSSIQPSLECFQGWGISRLSGQPVPGPHHPHSEQFLLLDLSNLNLPFFSLKPPPLVLSPHTLAKSPSPALLQAPSGYWKAPIRSPRSQAAQPQLSQPFLPAEGFQPSHHRRGLLWPHSSSSRSFLC